MKAKATIILLTMSILAAGARAEAGVEYVETYSTVIPFDFLLGDQTQAAGRYKVFRHPDWQLLMMCRDSVHCSTIQVRDLRGMGRNMGPRLGFDWDGARYRLVVVQRNRGKGYLLPGVSKDAVINGTRQGLELTWIDSRKDGS
jgi:hypothetical protein